MDLSYEHWEGLKPPERESLACDLAKQLPLGFEFHAIESRQYAGRSREIAFFKKDEAFFALIPGWTGVLGFDVACWQPNEEEVESWKETAEAYELSSTISEWVASQTLNVRAVKLAPFLMETTPREPGWQPVDVHDAEVQRVLREHKIKNSIEIHHGAAILRVRRESNESFVADRALPLTYSEAAKPGGDFRLPTSDEWEYACGAGMGTLFRWGDHAPCDRYPTDIKPEGRPDWEFHRDPNAFGLEIASDPYRSELVAEVGLSRGGDGGGAICGGAGFFAGWLTLATAYFDKDACVNDPTDSIAHGYTVCRRVLELK